MSDQLIMESFRHNFIIVGLLILVVYWTVSQSVTKLTTRVKVLEEKHVIVKTEAMYNSMAGINPNHGITASGMRGIDTQLGPSGTNRLVPVGRGRRLRRSGFMGSGGEPPVFYDVGDVRAARATRGWSTGVLTDSAGNPVYGKDGKPVMASKAGDYKSLARRKALYKGSTTSGSEGMFVPTKEGLWSPNEGFKSDEELMYNH
jgi:hypothetical protein